MCLTRTCFTGGYLEVADGVEVTELKIRKPIQETIEDDSEANESSDMVYILCLDESGSMSGEFENLKLAYRSFLAGIDGGTHRVTVINFDDRARFITPKSNPSPEPVPIADAPKDLPFKGGSTNFYEPMVLVGQVMAHPSCAHSNFNVLFMTDGDGQGPGTLVTDYSAKYGSRYVQNVVGLGTNVNATMMEALTAGGGTYRNAETGNDLKHIFDSIALDSKISASPVWLWFEKKGTSEQLWRYTSDGCLESQLNHNVLDGEYANLITRQKNSRSKDQQWIFTKDGYIVSNSRYLIPLPSSQKKQKNSKAPPPAAAAAAPAAGDKAEAADSKKPLVTLNNSEKEELQQLLHEIEIQITTKSNQTIHLMLILEAVSCLSSMLVNHQKEALSAVALTAKGALKSVMMRKIDQDLLNGVCKCIAAGFEVYKHFSSEKQFQMIQQLKCPRQLSDPLWITYEQLIITSMAMESIEGNWLLSVNYLSHLLRAAHLALRSFPSQSPSQSQCLRILTACIQGDGCVIGINKLLRKATKNRTPSKNISNVLIRTILDGESLSDTLRQVIMEAMGEMLESVEKIALNEVQECLKVLAQPILVTLQETAPTFLTAMRYVTNTLKSLKEWKDSFEKCLNKVLKHIKGILKLIESMSHYVNIFKITIKPTEVEQRITQVLSHCHFNSLSFQPALHILLHPPSHMRSQSSSKLPSPVRDEIDQVVVMIALLQRIFTESEKSLTQLTNSFSNFNFPFKEIEKYTIYKENAINSKSSNFFKMTPPNPTSHLQSLRNDLPHFIQTTLDIQRTLESKCSFFRFGIEVISKVEDLFSLTSQLPLSQLNELDAFQDNAEKFIEKRLKKTIKQLMKDLKKCYDPKLFGTGWWTSLSDVWGTCSFSDAMGALRQALTTLIGPGQFPERVEESAILSILELENITNHLWQSLMNGSLSSSSLPQSQSQQQQQSQSQSQSQQQICDELQRLVDGMRVTISQAKAASTNTNVQLLLSQERYREKVKYSLQETWQLIEEDVILKNMEAFHSQESLRQTTKQCRDEGELSNLTGLIDTIHHSIAENESIERIAMAQEACQELMTGQSGVAGLGRGLMIQLANLKRQMELSTDDLTEMIMVADPRWGMDYKAGTPQSQDLASSFSCQQFTRVTPVYIPRSQYYTPQGHNSYNNYHLHYHGGNGTGDSGQDSLIGSCPVCGGGRCPACGGHPPPPPPANGFIRNDSPPRNRPRGRPASAGSTRPRPNTRPGIGDGTADGAGRLYLPVNPLGAQSFTRADRFYRTPQREVCISSLSPSDSHSSPLTVLSIGCISRSSQTR
jgi:hypothetical protein